MVKQIGDTDAIRIYFGKETNLWTIEPPKIVVKEWAVLRGVNTDGCGRWNIKQTRDILEVARAVQEITGLIKKARKKKEV